MRASDIIRSIETLAPTWLATEHDQVGLRAGDPAREISSVALALDATCDNAEAAVRAGSQMLITHHPAFYKGLMTLDPRTPDGRLASVVLKHDLVLYSAHTNLDIAEGGVNDVIASMLHLHHTEPLAHEDTRIPVQKLVVFVPESHVDALREALAAAGAGVIGAYRSCTWSTQGTGTFYGDETTNPAVGKRGTLERIDEIRLETILPRGCKHAVLKALRATHPYEEPAYDIYTLDDDTMRGCGRVGDLDNPMKLDGFAATVRDAFGASHVEVFGEGTARIARVAVWGGGSVPVGMAVRAKADVLVAGEFKYHDCDIARAGGMALVALGHGVSEQVVLEPLAARLRTLAPEVSFTVLPQSYSVFRAI